MGHSLDTIVNHSRGANNNKQNKLINIKELISVISGYAYSLNISKQLNLFPQFISVKITFYIS